MNVLYVTAEVPFPLTSGYLRHFHFLSGLAAEHRLVHLSLTRRAAVSEEARAALEPHVAELRVFGAGRRRGRAARALRLRRAARQLRLAVGQELATGRYDAVVLSGKDTFPVLAAIRDTGLVVDVCDAASLRIGGELAVAPLWRRPLLAVRRAELRRIERELVSRTPHLLFATERDRAAVGAQRGAIVPNGIDLAHWTRRPGAPAPDPNAVVFTGVMSYRPNHDAAMRLVREVLPRLRLLVPEARIVLAGRDPLPELLAAAAHAGDAVEITGALEDLRPAMERARVYCAPLRFAAGIQNKLLEALAMELAVVSTPVAADGLRLAGRELPVVVADDDDGLARALARLLGDGAERERLATAGRAYVQDGFSWSRAIAELDRALIAAAHERIPRRPGPPAPGRIASIAGRLR